MGKVIEFRVPGELLLDEEIPICESCGAVLKKMKVKMERVMKWKKRIGAYEICEDEGILLDSDEMTCCECGESVKGGEREIN